MHKSSRRRSLTANELFQLRNALQAATLSALMDSRRWEPGDLAFQGGTCLHLVHGSPRFSEDLDFMVRGGMSIAGLEAGIQQRLALPPTAPPGLKLTVSVGKDEHNPHAFVVTAAGQGYLGSAKVKVELWRTPGSVMQQLQLLVRPVMTQLAATALVPTLTLPEILADKVYALAVRERLKPRDVFDLWLLRTQHAQTAPRVQPELLALRLQIYPRGAPAETAAQWLASAAQRLEQLRAGGAARQALEQFVQEDLAKWLPSYWSAPGGDAAAMLDVSSQWLREGIDAMQQIQSELYRGELLDEDAPVATARERGTESP